jgi:hypothetical protein
MGTCVSVLSVKKMEILYKHLHVNKEVHVEVY